ncbi:PAS domain S-box-containing protein [Hymenobacter gelipurpurascens]|uniref:histidine kinase n=2 Tax=Hymenobacter gelipurpurascens TaxID=89968 RepID=A0A212T1T5_9BACT|nr:PAS domain S-box-containing protein [Hymenobacter gelipurpurascens]
MPHHDPQSDSAQALRHLRDDAERKRLVAQSIETKTPEEVRQLAQGLQIHQIELEMQLEELQRAQVESESIRAQYVDLYDFAPIGYCTLTQAGEIRQLNLHLSNLLGHTRRELLGRSFALFVALPQRNEFSEFLEAAMQQEQRQSCEVEIRCSSGTSIFARLQGLAYTDANGERLCRLVVLDVTPQRTATEALKASELRFRTLFEQSADAVLLVENGYYIDCNNAAMRLLGATDKSQILGKTIQETSPEFQPNGQRSSTLVMEYMLRAQQQGSYRFEWLRNRLTGEALWMEIVVTPLVVEGSTVLHVLWRDITERKFNDQRLRASEERLRLALQGSAMGVWVWDLNTDELYWDQRAQEIIGHPFNANPVSFSRLMAAIHPEDLANASAVLLRARQNQQPFELEHRVVWPDGTIRFVTTSGQVLPVAPGEPLRLTGLIRDVTARYEREEELDYKNRLLEHIVNNTPVILGRLTPEGKYLELIGKGLRRMEIADNQLANQSIFDLFPNVSEEVKPLLAGQQVSFISRGPHNDEMLYFQNYGFFDEQKKQAILFAIDITASEQMKVQLHTEKEFTEQLLDSTVDMIAALNQEGHITAWNHTAEIQTGLSAEQVLGHPLREFQLSNNQTEFCASIDKALHGEPVTRLGWKDIIRTGAYYDVYLVPLLRDNANVGALLIMREATAREELLIETTRLKLRQQKEVLDAILTAQEDERRRIAEALHNGVGQLLYAIKLHLENTAELPRTNAGLALLDEAIRATRGISFELTPGVLEDFGLETALKELVKRIPKPPIRLHCDIPRNLPRTIQVALYRIVQELLNNIMKHAKAGEVFVYLEQVDQQLHLSVEDDGIGFEYQQTTPSKGIGLSSIRNRVELLNGHFTIQSRPGHGTIVTIQVPLA